MTDLPDGPAPDLPPGQQAIRDHCVHPAGTFIPFPRAALETSLPQRFAEQVRRAPGRLAVRSRRYGFTYAELNAFASRIAGAIAHRNGGHDTPVALLFDDAALAVAAMIGVLKAGRPYVPLDPSYPRPWLEHILHDATARLLLTDDAHVAAARSLAAEDVRVINVQAAEDADVAPDRTVTPRSPAFIIYTSGSTGRPKGVIQTHANVLHDVWHYTNSGHFCADDRFLLVSSISFADSVRTIYGSLLNGAALLPFNLHAEGVGGLGAWMQQQHITIYRSVPTVFRHLVRTLSRDTPFESLRLIYLGGEQVRSTDVEAYRQWFPRSCALVNRLGTTETLTFRMYFMNHDVDLGDGVPVGYAVPDYDLFLLDERGEPTRDGEVGEMAVRSRYLSPGFWRRPDLSEALFTTDQRDPGVRTYRTGDLGRLRSDGCLEHLGRKDFQVKIRGHRIEASEVESALLTLGSLREAAVVAEQRASSERLVAYVVPSDSPAPSPDELRMQLSARLPEYMVPSRYVLLQALPQLPNGKVNRQALPAAPPLNPTMRPAPVSPRSDVEVEIARMWSEVLETAIEDVHEHFADLGGDSLSAGRVLARLRVRFGVEPSLAALWRASTVAGMAELVKRHLERPGGG
jgi:amino acid adenylation domain-containing protein